MLNRMLSDCTLQMPADVRKSVWISVDEESLYTPVALFFESYLFLKIGGEVGGRSWEFSIVSIHGME